jgi:N-acetylglucosaminyldiphosphoundecaprenol N-acetyl-beta-D-mannosaminyltransferase
VDFAMLARDDIEFRDVINQASLCVADGMPLVWAARLLRDPLPGRVNGTNLMYALCRDGQERHHRFFLLGAEPDVSSRAAEILAREYPGIVIAGYYSPPFGPFSDEENQRIVQMIREARPDVLLVAIGPPKAQKWIAAHQEACGVPIAMGIGGALDFVGGKYRRGPGWVEGYGVGRVFRMGVGFKRVWGGYLVRDMQFIPAVLMQRLKAR